MKIQSLFFLAALTLLSLPLWSQSRINPKVGVNISALDANLQDLRTQARVGWNAGIDARLGDGVIFFQPGLHYYSFTARMFQDVEPSTDVAMRDETTIQSLKLPVNLGLRLTGDNGLLGIYARGGVTGSYILGVKEKPGFALNKASLNDFTLGANFGLGVDLLFFTVDAGYEIGLTDFYSEAEGRNNVFTLSAGIKF